MTSKGIAQRLTAKYGPTIATSLGLMMAEDARDLLNQTPAQESRTTAKYLTRSMFWLSVLHHIEQA
jgi:hypothetical protein